VLTPLRRLVHAVGEFLETRLHLSATHLEDGPRGPWSAEENRKNTGNASGNESLWVRDRG